MGKNAVKIFCIIIFIIIAGVMLHKTRGTGSMYNGILVGGLVYYGVVPFFNEINKDEIFKSDNYYVNMGTGKYVVTYLMIIVFFFFFFLSNNSSLKRRKYINVPDEKRLYKFLKFVAYYCFIVGGASLFMFFGALGGISQALEISEKARSFATSLTDYMPYYASLLIIPARLIMVAPYCFWALSYLTERKKRRYRILTVTSFVFAVLFCLFNAGRAPLLAMILCIVIPVMLNKRIKHTWLLIMLIGVAAMPLLDVLDQLFVYWQSGEFELEETNYFSYLSQFSYPINNVFHAFDIGNEYGYRYGKDFITCILDMLPGFTFEPSYEGTSEYMAGPRWRVAGGTPNDIITLALLEFHVLGLLIMPLVLGKISRFVDEFTGGCRDKRTGRVLSTVITVNSFLMVGNADPVAIFRAFTLWIIPMVMVLSTSKIRNNRGQVYNE